MCRPFYHVNDIGRNFGKNALVDRPFPLDKYSTIIDFGPK